MNTDRVPRYRSEQELRIAIAQLLRTQGIPVAEQVPCATGIADLVAGRNEIIYECKLRLTRITMQQAMGQLLLYQASLNPQARLVMIGYPTSEMSNLLPYLDHAGIRVIAWQDRNEIGHTVQHTTGTPHEETPKPTIARDAVRSNPSLVSLSRPLSSLPPSLRWNVAALAHQRGLKNVPALADRMGVIRQALYELWKGDAGQVTLVRFSQLCHALDADPGDWFRWGTEREGTRQLVWAIAQEAEARGFKMTELSHVTDIYNRSMGPMWHNTAQAFAPSTLARIATTLDAVRPFSIGDLFVWADTLPEISFNVRKTLHWNGQRPFVFAQSLRHQLPASV